MYGSPTINDVSSAGTGIMIPILAGEKRQIHLDGANEGINGSFKV